jgi:hypothetical protein
MVRRRQDHRGRRCAYVLGAVSLLASSGCSTGNLALPGGGGAGFTRVLTDLQVVYARGADGSETFTYTSAPNAATNQALSIAEALTGILARGGLPAVVPRALPERLLSPEVEAKR